MFSLLRRKLSLLLPRFGRQVLFHARPVGDDSSQGVAHECPFVDDLFESPPQPQFTAVKHRQELVRGNDIELKPIAIANIGATLS